MTEANTSSMAAPVLAPARQPACYHCGLDCPDDRIRDDDRIFCCTGCLAVYRLLHDRGLGRFYELETAPGATVGGGDPGRFAYLDDPVVRAQMLDFSDGRTARVTLRIPAIHCIACVWLLENLFRLNPAVGASTVDFPRREVRLAYDETKLSFSGLVGFLASLGYEPSLTMAAGEKGGRDPARRELAIRIGVAGFAFGNVMMLSFPSYLGLGAHGPELFGRFCGGWSLLLALPVLLVSARGYWSAAWRSLAQRRITIELPIALGLAALFLQSAWEIGTGAGPGYLDSLCGLVFFLLTGQWFQRRTYDALSFDRDYRSYFPLSVVRREDGAERAVPIHRLQVGDRIVVRHQELVPADARLVAGEAFIDYSFITGEAAPVARAPGERVYAGGRQLGGAIELETLKPVSQSHLASLWDDARFRKPLPGGMSALTNAAGRWFTYGVLALALGATAFWLAREPARAARVFASILIVACPCALALAAPFTLGTGVRLLGRRGLFLRNSETLETLARVDTVVFDKTGTLTRAADAAPVWSGDDLAPAQRAAAGALARHSAHPLSRHLAAWATEGAAAVADFREHPGRGVEGAAGGVTVRLGSRRWMEELGLRLPAADLAPDGAVCFAEGPVVLGAFALASPMRADAGAVARGLGDELAVAVLTGDTARDRAALEDLFARRADLRFGQDPAAKRDFVRDLQEKGRRVLMVGDGLNDAAALRQSDVGLALAEDVSAFSPAADAILDARAFALLPAALRFARASRRVILGCFGLSLAYNAVGLAFAAQGSLSPLVSAILMPASSVSVVVAAVLATRLAARRWGVAGR